MSKAVESEGSVARTCTTPEVLFTSESLSSLVMLAVKVLGAGRHVGKSACLIEIDNCRVLLDCGIQVTANGMAKFPNLVSLYRRVEQCSVQDVAKSLSSSQPASEKPMMDENHMSGEVMLDTSSGGVPSAKKHNSTPSSSDSRIHSFGDRRPCCSSYQCVVDVVLITHFHLDHVGALPILTEVLGYYGPILMTEATFRQAKLQLEDCWLNQTSSRGHVNVTSVSCEVPSNDSPVSHDAIDFCFSHSEEGEADPGHDPDISTGKKDGEFPRYWEASLDYEMIQSCLSKITRVSFSDPIQMKTLQITLLAAGHVPGACMFQIEGLQTGHSVLYTGDFTTNGEQVIPVAQVPQLHPTLLVSEGTYASQVRESKRAVERDLCCAVENAVRRGGNVLIPISALGKAQELALILSLHWKACHLTFPIVLASGMMEKAFSGLKDSGASLLPHVHEALDFISFMDVKRVLECAQTTPLVYFCSPRSLQAGSSLQMLHAWGNNPLNLILLLGYSLPSTIAHEIIKGTKCLDLPLPSHSLLHDHLPVEDSNEYKSFDTINQHTPPQTQPFVLLAKMRYYSLGSHADSLAIQTFLQYASPLMTLLVHGEGTGLATLAQHLNQTVQRPTLAPENNDVIIVHSGSIPPPLRVTPLQHQLQSFMDQLDFSSSSSGVSEFNLRTLSLSKALQQQFGHINKWISSQWSRSALKSFRPAPPFEQNKISCESLFEKWCPSLISSLESPVPLFLSLDLIEKQFIQDVVQKNTPPTFPSALVNDDEQHLSTSKLPPQSFFLHNQSDTPSTMRRNISQPFISPSFSTPITSSKHTEKGSQEDQEEKYKEEEEEEEEEGEIRFEKKIS